MPTYEYTCRACDHRFEAFQKMSDEPLKDCPECGRPEAERQISAGGGLVFKGPGFYATDYRKEPAPSEGPGPAEEAGGGGGGSAGKDSGSTKKGPGKGKSKSP